MIGRQNRFVQRPAVLHAPIHVGGELIRQFVIVARKTARLLDLLHGAEWKPSPKTDADAQCEFTYQPDGWEKAFRFVALRYEQPQPPADEVEQYQLFATSKYTYRVFVTSLELLFTGEDFSHTDLLVAN